MSWRTHPATQHLRTLARALGINRLVAGWRARGSGYEQDFQEAMLAAVRPGDVVWDIGANVGLYTCRFAELAGSGGHVYAFEPSPQNLERLRQATSDYPQVTVMPIGLGESDGESALLQGADDLGATSRVVAPGIAGATEIVVRQGAGLVASGEARSPTMAKIDTEGFELDVLRGIEPLLAELTFHTLCIEVHFELLDERGLARAPRAIEAMLRRAGYAVRWPDMSHIVATRAR